MTRCRLDLDDIFSSADAARAGRVLGKLSRHDTSGWVLAGGLALEIHRRLRAIEAPLRQLHDIDFVVESFDRIPSTLQEDFVFRHIHPHDPPAKTLLQAVDLEDAVRLDVFRAYGSVIARSAPPVMLGALAVRLISLEDIVARLARLSWDLAARGPVAAKYVRDLLATIDLGDKADLDTAWQDHRKPYMPPSFRDAIASLQATICSHPHLLISSEYSPEYSKDTQQVCERCHETQTFRLADAVTILSVLGYC